MSVYQKNIIYLYVYQNNEKLQNAGFVKLEHMNERYGLFARIKNAGDDQNGEFDVYMKEGNGKTRFCVGRMILHNGCGDFKIVWNARHVEDIEKLWESFEIIEIMLNGEKKLLGLNKHVLMRAEEVSAEEQIILEEKDVNPEGRREADKIEKMLKTQKEHEKNTEEQKISEEPPKKSADEIKSAEGMNMEEYEADKWKELLRTYPNVHPFGDDRCYIALEPKDFPLLTAEYQHLSGNSFLLHGFYNYRHIILGKEDDYLLGVPGTYHEREKMMALMFGFEGFESENKNPCTGTFGYYMRRVKI